MSRIIGTQEFLREHREHSLDLSVLETIQRSGPAEVEQDATGTLYVNLIEVEEIAHVQTQAVYLACHDCGVEEEINLSEYNEED